MSFKSKTAGKTAADAEASQDHLNEVSNRQLKFQTGIYREKHPLPPEKNRTRFKNRQYRPDRRPFLLYLMVFLLIIYIILQFLK
jgi:hypothetical protein